MKVRSQGKQRQKFNLGLNYDLKYIISTHFPCYYVIERIIKIVKLRIIVYSIFGTKRNSSNVNILKTSDGSMSTILPIAE